MRVISHILRRFSWFATGARVFNIFACFFISISVPAQTDALPPHPRLLLNGNGISEIHANYAREIINDGLVYQVTGDKIYASHAREILLAYAERYLTYPVHDNQGKPGGRGGHVASQSLTEASWLIDIEQGADL